MRGPGPHSSSTSIANGVAVILLFHGDTLIVLSWNPRNMNFGPPWYPKIHEYI